MMFLARQENWAVLWKSYLFSPQAASQTEQIELVGVQIVQNTHQQEDSPGMTNSDLVVSGK